jgi:HAD superfamily hydrolase (TIGR01509 family)
VRFDAFIFDVGDILYDVTLWRKWLAGYLRGLGAEIDYPTLVEKWEAALGPVYVSRREYWDAFRGMLASLNLNDGQIGDAVAAAQAKAKSPEVKARQLFDGVADTLHQLRNKGCKLGVLSDTESSAEKVYSQLAEMGIADAFDAILTSHDLGATKPDPIAFTAALTALGVTKERAAFVAHDDNELTGAMDFGITAIAFNFVPGVSANHHIWHFSELLRLAE